MDPVTGQLEQHPPRDAGSDTLHAEARRDVALAAVALLLLGAGIASRLSGVAAWFFAAGSAATFAAGAWLVLRHLELHRPQRRFGAANRVTLARLVLCAAVAGLLGCYSAADPGGARPQSTVVAALVAVIATVGWLLDAVDGWLARRARTSSAFGALFDMETDAALVMALCLHAWLLGRTGAWVLLAGLLRYAFVLAGRRWPWLDRPLPPSGLRKLVCAVLTACLVVCIAPGVPAALQWLSAAAGVLLVVASFARDVAWLAARRSLSLVPAR